MTVSSRHLPILGISNVDFPYPSPAGMEWFEDFVEFGSNDISLAAAATGKWTVGGTNGVVASVTVPTITLADGGANVCGAINLITTGANADDTFIQLRGGSFYCVAGRPMRFQVRFRANSITTTTHTFGMYVPNTIGTLTTNPLDSATNGIGLNIVNGAVTFQVKNASTTVTGQATTGTIAASTTTVWNTVGFYWDGINALTFYVNGKSVGSYNGAAIPTGLYLTPTLGITTTAAATPDMDIDYVAVSVEGVGAGR